MRHSPACAAKCTEAATAECARVLDELARAISRNLHDEGAAKRSKAARQWNAGLNQALALIGEVPMNEPRTEAATRKVLMSPELMDEWASRDMAGNRLRWDWRVPGEDGFWEPTITVDYTDNLATAERERVLDITEDHHPEIGSCVDDSSWLMCSCGWDSSKEEAVGWHDHLLAALALSQAAAALPIAGDRTEELQCGQCGDWLMPYDIEGHLAFHGRRLPRPRRGRPTARPLPSSMRG